ncbi:MAG: DNA primase [Chitinophagaceae bacterium]|nr:DNA primase [Chitinophagaceae bacterium]
MPDKKEIRIPFQLLFIPLTSSRFDRVMITAQTIQEILNRVDIVDVIGDFVKLKKRGANYLGLCPFHDERTPSFTVSPSKEIFKCFGCGKSGNVVSFVMEHEKLSYPEALRWLAAKYGIEVQEEFKTDEQKEQRLTADSLYIINDFAKQFFVQQLHETEDGRAIGLSYFAERGFEMNTIRKFELGYLPEQKNVFARAALAARFNPELLVKAGLITKKNEEWTDTYSGRIIFPVHNLSGKISGFGARTLKSQDKAPKYINTPENEIYVKSKILYGLYFARQAIHKLNECLLVEGYTDVISMHQAGIENVVASGGTSLTAEQLSLIKKYTRNLTIIYDGDTAGIKAALRGLDLAIESGLQVKLVLLPEKEDPDSYVNRIGKEAFTEFIQKNKKDFILFQLEVGLKEAGQDATKKAEVVNRIAESISKINKAEHFTLQQDYIRQAAALLKIDEAGLHHLVNTFIRDRISRQEKKLPYEEARQLEENAQKAEAAGFDDLTFELLFKDELQEKEIIRMLLEYGHLPWKDNLLIADYIFSEIDAEGMLENPEVQQMAEEYHKHFKEKNEISLSQHFVYHPDPKISALAVSLFHSPYEVSERWKNILGKESGFQPSLFRLPYKSFTKLVTGKDNSELLAYLKTEEKDILGEVQSVITYLKLKKIKRLIFQNLQDMENLPPGSDFMVYYKTHEHLKKMEIALSEKIGAVILR